MNNRVLVLLSGGIDSSTLAARLTKENHVLEALFFDIRQSSVEYERKAAQDICTLLEVPFREVSLEDWREQFPREVEMLVIPRNLILASLAIPYARSLSCDRIALGSTDDDRDVRDSNGDAIEAFNNMLATLGQPMRLFAPWIEKDGWAKDTKWSKREIVEWALANEGRDFIDLTRSCYSSREPCGHCRACQNRNKALGGADYPSSTHPSK